MTLPDRADALLLLHNPNCSKSRAVQALLEERGATFKLRLYLEDPLSAPELAELERRLGQPIATWVREREEPFAALEEHQRQGHELRAAVAEHPILMERPILVGSAEAKIGRPPEQVLELL